MMGTYDDQGLGALHLDGFELEHTGGNCLALVRVEGDTVAVVTGLDGPFVYTVGVYTVEGWNTGGDPLSVSEGLSLSDVLRMVAPCAACARVEAAGFGPDACSAHYPR